MIDLYARIKLAADAQPNDQAQAQQFIQDHSGEAAALGGAYAMSKARPLVTGRTRLYHGTHAAGAEAIRREGLRPTSEGLGGGKITDVLGADIKGPAQKMVYMTPKHMEARTYAAQAELLQGKGPNYMQTPEAQIARIKSGLKATFNPFQKNVLTADVPLWKKEIAERLRANPEARGSFENFRKAVDPFGLQPDFMLRASHDSLNRAVVMEGSLGPEYIRGSKAFKGVNLQELQQYARAKPGRMAAGVGLGAAGAGAAAYGLHHLYGKYVKPHLNQPAAQGAP